MLYVHGDGGGRARAALERAAAAVGVALHPVAAAAAQSEIDERAARGQLPLAVLIEVGTGARLHVVRHLRLVAPHVQAVFLAARGEDRELRSDAASASIMGHHWTVVDPAGPALERALAEAVRSTRQRRRLRTTLQRMNVRLAVGDEGATAPPALVISNAFLASLLEHLDEAILAIDRSDRIASWNRGAASAFGYQRAEVVGSPVDVLVAPDRTGDLLAMAHAAWGGEVVERAEIECRRFDGERFPAEVTLAPVADDNGATIAISLVARDISHRKRQEAQVRALNLELEERLAAERAANAALSSALDALETKERELSRLRDAAGDG